MVKTSKKLIAAFLVVMLAVVFVAPTAFAKDHGGSRNINGLVNGKATWKIGFRDIDEKMNWARLAIDKMFAKGIIKGYPDNYFKPNDHVTHLEAIIMAMRVMGWEEEAKNIKVMPSGIKNLNLAWDQAYYYIALAVEKGIVKPAELLGFKPNDPAKRYEVAKYIVRAIEKEKEAEKHMKEKLPFKDANAIPKDAVGYVYVMVDMGLMKGDERGLFQPNKPITRAEMAVLIDRLDDKANPEEENELVGVISAIDEDDLTITIKSSAGRKTYDVVKGVPVYFDNAYLDFEDLNVGDEVELTLNSAKEVVFIQLLDDEKGDDESQVIITAKGLVVDVDEDDKTISLHTVIKAEGQGFIGILEESDVEGKHYELDTEYGTFVLLGNTDDMDDYVGRKIIVKGQIKDVFSIYMRGEVIDVKEFYPVRSKDIVTFEVDKNTKITVDGKRADLDDITVGDFVQVEADEDDVAFKITVESIKEYLEKRGLNQEEEKIKDGRLEGKITKINDAGSKLRIQTKDGLYTLLIADDVELDEEIDDIKDLVGKKVELNIKKGKVVEIELEY